MTDLGNKKKRRRLQPEVAVWRAILTPAVLAMSGPGIADDDGSALPTDCDTARNWAKSEYGSMMCYLDALNRCA